MFTHTVVSVDRDGTVAEITVEVDGERRPAISYTDLTGPVEAGDDVVVNVTEARGTGGPLVECESMGASRRQIYLGYQAVCEADVRRRMQDQSCPRLWVIAESDILRVEQAANDLGHCLPAKVQLLLHNPRCLCNDDRIYE